jgi:hypothetical protein
MMKNARNVFSKKTLHTENHTKIVWQLPHTQAATNLAKAKPATLVKHCCADLEHRTIATPYIVPLHPKYLHHCAPYVVPLYHSHCVTAPPASYHCTPYIVPLYPVHRTIAPHLSYHCTSFIVPLRPLHGTIAPATSYHCTPTSYHCTPRTAPLVPGVPASPYHCAVFTAPSHLHFAPPYLRFVPLENHHRTYLQTTSQSSAFEIW